MEPEIKRIELEFSLPEPIIQHIQWFLGGKGAAQTTILSKSWHTAWLTRPNLDFDQRDFGCTSEDPGNEEGFWELVKKTMRRYEVLNRKIESLRLLVRGDYRVRWRKVVNFRAKELIVKAMKMGVSDLHFEPLHTSCLSDLPHGVLGSETLTRLSVVGCKIELGAEAMVRCSKLKSLTLRRVHLGGDVIWDILSCCPLVDKLSVSECQLLPEVDVSSLRSSSPLTVFGNRNVGPTYSVPTKQYELHTLKCFVLSEVNVDPLTFHDFLSGLSCLKELILNDCSCNSKRIRICSRSLEFITFSQSKMLKADLHVPSIRKLKIRSSNVPSLMIEASSTNWESDISIICEQYCNSWCLNLRSLLTSLRPSRIHLSLTISSALYRHIDFQGLHRTASEDMAVERLIIEAACPVCFTLLKFFFRCSSPKSVTLYVPSYKEWNNGNNVFPTILPNTSSRKRLRTARSTLRQIMFNYNNKGLRMKNFDEVLAGWKPLALSTSVDDSTHPGKPKICFQLTW